MPGNTRDLRDELIRHLRVLARQHRKVPYLNIPQLSGIIRREARYLQLPAIRRERLRTEQILMSAMIRARGAWISRHDSQEVPREFIFGHHRRAGVKKRVIFRHFIQTMSKHPELGQDLQKVLGLTFPELKRVQRKWQLLLSREEKYARQYPASVQRLRSLLPIVRGAVNDISSSLTRQN